MINSSFAGGYMGSKPPLFSLERIKGLLGNTPDTVKEGAKAIFASEIAAEGWRDVFTGVRGGIGNIGNSLSGSAGAVGADVAAATAGSASGAASSGIQAVQLAPVGRDAAGRFIHLDVAKLGAVGRDASGRFVSLKGAAGAVESGLTTVGSATELAGSAPKTGLGGFFQRLFGGGKTPPAEIGGAVPATPAIPAAPPVATNPAAIPGGPVKVNIGLEFAGPAQARDVTTVKIIRQPIKVNGVPNGGGSGAGSTVGTVGDDVANVGANGATGNAGSSTAGSTGSALRSGLGKILEGAKAGAKNGALFGGVISAVINGFQVLTGKKRLSEGVGTVAADTASGAVAGATGAVASGLALA
ncbi:MAG: hypothetical protein FJZ01_27170, partial [Candidatus Sericytochromatia bacterium]|nr:hypothetical protein [Candidatus Tanganyikabacteria bacterium]